MGVNKNMVYGIPSNNLVLLPEDLAAAIASDLEKIYALETYGEARRLETQLLTVPGLDDDDYDEAPPEASDPYDCTTTNECQEGNWPPRAATVALDYLAEDETLDDIGEERENLGGVPFLYIDPADEQELIATLRNRGYELRRDDELIGRIDP
jgi:hypothetical protein